MRKPEDGVPAFITALRASEITGISLTTIRRYYRSGLLKPSAYYETARSRVPLFRLLDVVQAKGTGRGHSHRVAVEALHALALDGSTVAADALRRMGIVPPEARKEAE